MNLVLATMGATMGIGIGIGVAVAAVVFGLIFVIAVQPFKKNKESSPAPAPEAHKPTESEEEEQAEKALEEQIAEEETEEEAEPAAEEEAQEEAAPAVAEEAEEEEEAEEAEEEPAEEEAEAEEAEEEREEISAEEAAALAAAREADAADEQNYNKSFMGRLMQAPDEIKQQYSEVKNAILSYKGARSSVAWKQETFKKGRLFIAKILIKGKTLCLYLAANAADYEGTRYKVEDVSSKAINAATPCLYRLKNPRRIKYAKELIDDVCKRLGLEEGGGKKVNYVKELTYKDNETLVAEGLAKPVNATEFGNIAKK